MNYDIASKKIEDIIFSELQRDIKSDRNEAQTRFHLIDEILFACLGWSKSDVEVELQEDGVFSDYELGKPRQLIIEAKREHQNYEFPVSTPKKLKIGLSSFSKNEQLKSAIEQARNYCVSRGVQNAVVTNGHQYIFFIASRTDGKKFWDGQAAVFKNLDEVRDNFQKFWDFLSVEGVKQGKIKKFLENDSEEVYLPHKISMSLIDYPRARYSSELQSTLRSLAEVFLQDVVDSENNEKNFFKRCYCDSGALSSYALLSKKILEARYAALFEGSESRPYIANVKEKNSSNLTPDILAESVSRRPIVLIGDVGVGKTSFVKNLMYSSAYEDFKKAIYIYIDLGAKAVLNKNISDKVLDEIEGQLFHKYQKDIMSYGFLKGVYASEISRFSSGMWGGIKERNPDLYQEKLASRIEELVRNRDEHLKKSIAFISKSNSKQIIICLDNSDQRDYDVQQDAFIIGQSLSREWLATVFIALRPQTFFKSKRSGVFAAYPHKIFTISPPRVDLVIEKRLMYALSMAEGEISYQQMEFVKVNSRSLAIFLKVLIQSLHNNKDLQEFLSNVTGGNIRSAIEFVTSFIGSPNVDAEKIIDIFESSGKYQIPLHEFTKQALLGDYSHFNSNTSVALNVFDVSKADEREHFLAPIMLAYLEVKSDFSDSDGFFQKNQMFYSIQECGFDLDQIHSCVRRLVNKKLLETSQRVTFEEDLNGLLIGDMPEKIRITTIGAYHLKRWMCSFSYIDAMAFDTPIFDDKVRSDMMVNLESLSIEDRYYRACKFRDYLIDVWASFDKKPEFFDFLNFISLGKSTFSSVEKKVTES